MKFYARQILSSTDYLALPDQYDLDEYRMMEDFSISLSDQDVGNRLHRAIKGRGAFRRFKDAINRFGIEDDWYRFRDERIKEIARYWCDSKSNQYDEV